MYFAEERTIGPSLGADNIAKGVEASLWAMLFVSLFIVIIYRFFGVIATVALGLNMVLLLALMSLLSATLTLPGIAGIVLTMGMAVDANVLIFSRIREEIANGMSIQRAIHEGFDRAYSAIVDANLTTLLVGGILFAMGTGPVKGFAVTLSLGILTSISQPRATLAASAARFSPGAVKLRVSSLSVRGSLPSSVVRRGVERIRPRLLACYRNAATRAGRHAFGTLEVSLEIDEHGRARSPRAEGAELPGLAACVREAALRIAARHAPDTGTVAASFRVELSP
jgi:hypothetical protein